MCLLPHKLLSEWNFVFLSLKLCKLVFEKSRFFFEISSKHCQSLSQKLVQSFFYFIWITFKSPHFLYNQLHLLFQFCLFAFNLIILLCFKLSEWGLVSLLKFFNSVLIMSLGYFSINNAQRTKGLAAFKAIKFEGSFRMSQTDAIKFIVWFLKVDKKWFIVLESEPLMLMRWIFFI